MRSSQSKPMTPGQKFFFRWIFPLIFILIGGLCLLLGVRGILRAKASISWPTAQGKIVESSVESRRSSGSKGKSSTTYKAEILYEFNVEDVTFSGNRVAYGDYGSSNSSHARGIVNRYPKGKSITVYYMQEDPEECLLEPGMKVQAFSLPGFGLIFFFIGCLMVVYVPRVTNKAQRNQNQNEHVEVQHDYGRMDETGSGHSLMTTDVKVSFRDGIRLLQVTMAYDEGPEKVWEDFNWQIDGNQLNEVIADLHRVINMVENGEGEKVRGRLMNRALGLSQNIKLLADLGHVAFNDGQDKANGLTGEMFGERYFMYETVVPGSASIQPFPLSSLRAILDVLETLN